MLLHLTKVVDVGGKHVDTVLQERLQKECPEILDHAHLEKFKRKYCYVRPERGTVAEKKEVSVNGKTYSVNGSVLTDPCEALFHPKEFNFSANGSLAEHIKSIIDEAVAQEKDLLKVASTIVLSGGPTLHEGFVARLEHELKGLFPDGSEFKITAQRTRHVDSWIGGSILGSLSTFPSMWITRQQYDSDGKRLFSKWHFLTTLTGPSLVPRRCF